MGSPVRGRQWLQLVLILLLLVSASMAESQGFISVQDPERVILRVDLARKQPPALDKCGGATYCCRTFEENQMMLVTCESDDAEELTFSAFIDDEMLPEIEDDWALTFSRQVSLDDSGKEVFCVANKARGSHIASSQHLLSNASASWWPAESTRISLTVLQSSAGPSSLEVEKECRVEGDWIRARVRDGGHLAHSWTREQGKCLRLSKSHAPPPTPLDDGEFEFRLLLSGVKALNPTDVQTYQLHLGGKQVFSCRVKPEGFSTSQKLRIVSDVLKFLLSIYTLYTFLK